jgi:Kef-type K+ transport system membrane component KefB
MEESSVLIDLFVLFAAAKVLGELFEHWRQPAVVGELLAGIVVGPHVLRWVDADAPVLDVVAQLGVVILLFTVGLETSVGDLRRFGRPALLVGVLGVALPFAAGGALMLALDYDRTDILFVAAALVATSVGVTARVLRDLGATRSPTARVVLGAAVVDDILAIVVLALVVGLATPGPVSIVSIVVLVVEIVAFLAVVFFAGPPLTRRLSQFVRLPGVPESPFLVAVLITLGLAALSETIGLAAIIGAFLAGAVFEFRREEVVAQVQPVYELLVPFFFAITGSRMDPAVFTDPGILLLAVVITVVAVVTKVAGGWLGALGLGRRTALAVGIGMVPRGEVGLIVAALGLSLGVISQSLYAVVLAMTLITTLITPPVLGPVVLRARAERKGR